MEIYCSPQKVVAISNNIFIVAFRNIYCFRGRLSYCAIYLFIILKSMDREKKLESLLIIAAGFLVLFFIFKIKLFVLIALIVAFFGAMSKVFASGVTWVWFKISQILGWINSRLLLSIVFFIFLFPLSLIMKAFGKSTIKLKKEKNTYYYQRDLVYKPEHLEDVW